MNNFFLTVFMAVLIFSSPKIHAKEWQELISKLHSEDAKVSEPAWKELSAIKDLEANLKKSLITNYRAEVLYITSRLQNINLAKYILEEQILHPIDAKAIFVLNQFLSSELKPVLLKNYSKWIENESLSSEFRLAVLNGLVQVEYKIPKKVLEKFLKNKSYQLRIEATRLAGLYSIEKGEEKDEYYTILKEAKLLRPYQVRLEAFFWISRLPLKLRKSMNVTTSLCLKESNAEVAMACKNSLEGIK